MAAEKTQKSKEELRGGFCSEQDIAVATLKKLADMTKLYKQQIVTQIAISDDNFDVKNRYVGKVVAKKELAQVTEELMAD